MGMVVLRRMSEIGLCMDRGWMKCREASGILGNKKMGR